jgi:hypothetical protein
MIREDRDPAFWTSVLAHPALEHMRHGQDPSIITLALDRALCLRAEHGGFLFFPADSFGLTLELHTLFTPEGWGREALEALREAIDLVFGRADLVITHETPHPQSRPPKTFRFAPMGEFRTTPHGRYRLWSLTRDAWLGSPARRR